ncbi:hypothetical protein [Halocatena marina]|uniref:Uncharacterized protein n=1 Tax=Halocatena marina TaxID=2934937 RepID=A0ABD5YM56_9EURY|nr:hypothetical protein [Halocatena marina]
MTKDAVWNTYREILERLTDEMLDVVEEEFGGGLVGKAIKKGTKSATKRIKKDMEKQGRIVVEYAAQENDGGRYQREFLATNPVYQRYSGNNRRELEEHLLSHFETVRADLAPLVSSETDDFWEALAEEYSREEATEIIERHFSQAETFERYKDDLFRSNKLGNKVITVLKEGETRLKKDLERQLDSTYDKQ